MLSFIVPAHNEEFELPSTLAAIQEAAKDRQRSRLEPSDVDGQAREGLRAGTRANQYEIIVADDASTDRTAEIASATGAQVVSIDRRQIAAARNAGARVAHGDIFFFVDADTRINSTHIINAIAALESGCVGGGARIALDGIIPRWGRIFLKIFSALYFANNLGAGAFLFTTRENYDAVGGFDEHYFAGEEVLFSQALKKLGRFTILREPIITSGRKLRMHSGWHIGWRTARLILGGLRSCRSRDKLDIWYDGKRESTSS